MTSKQQRTGANILFLRYLFASLRYFAPSVHAPLLGQSDYITIKENTSGNFGRPFWRYSLFCNTLKKVCKDLPASQRARCSLDKSHLWVMSHGFPTAELNDSSDIAHQQCMNSMLSIEGSYRQTSTSKLHRRLLVYNAIYVDVKWRKTVHQVLLHQVLLYYSRWLKKLPLLVAKFVVAGDENNGA